MTEGGGRLGLIGLEPLEQEGYTDSTMIPKTHLYAEHNMSIYEWTAAHLNDAWTLTVQRCERRIEQATRPSAPQTHDRKHETGSTLRRTCTCMLNEGAAEVID